MDFHIKTLTKDVDCKIVAQPRKNSKPMSGGKTGKIGVILSQLASLEEEVVPYGIIHIKTTSAPLFGISGNVQRGKIPIVKMHLGDEGGKCIKFK